MNTFSSSRVQIPTFTNLFREIDGFLHAVEQEVGFLPLLYVREKERALLGLWDESIKDWPVIYDAPPLTDYIDLKRMKQAAQQQNKSFADYWYYTGSLFHDSFGSLSTYENPLEEPYCYSTDRKHSLLFDGDNALQEIRADPLVVAMTPRKKIWKFIGEIS